MNYLFITKQNLNDLIHGFITQKDLQGNQILNEYRCFVCHEKFNAVSRYQSIDNEQQMRNFLNSIQSCNCRLFNKSNELRSNIIIPINPFSKRYSAGKFLLITDTDIFMDLFLLNCE
jgi:hypothetical protein